MTIGLIGAGDIRSQVARLAVANGYNVVISNSRGPETLASLVAELGPKARAASAAEAAQAGDIVVVTVPLKNYRQVPVEPLAWKIVIDTNNYYPQRDGHIAEVDNESTTTSELLQAHLPRSRVVKAFNHIYAADLTTHGQPAGTENRRALVVVGDDAKAKATVTRLLDQFGFDAVDAGPLKEGWRIQRDTPGYGPRRTAEELRRDLAAAKRYADQVRRSVTRTGPQYCTGCMAGHGHHCGVNGEVPPAGIDHLLRAILSMFVELGVRSAYQCSPPIPRSCPCVLISPLLCGPTQQVL